MNSRWGNAKPIETMYKGYRFRSRLEARWAVFFDALRVEWEYEPEGFELDGLRYLPDFLLKEHGCFVEIKPRIPTSEEIEKAKQLHLQSGFTVVISMGLPGETYSFAHMTDSSDSGGDYMLWDRVRWYRCRNCGAFDQSYGDDSHAVVDALTGEPMKRCDCYVEERQFDDPQVQRAYVAAKSARFEFGR